jgi:Fe2+ transport system protein FeoA
MNIMSLQQVPRGNPYKIIQITAGLETRKKLLAMGIHVGDLISKINQTHWNPILIRNLTTQSSKIAISHGLAKKIMVGDGPL